MILLRDQIATLVSRVGNSLNVTETTGVGPCP